MIRNRARSRPAAVLVSSLAIAAGGLAAGGCGDDNEGPAEEAGKAIDTAANEATQAIKKGAHEVDKNVDVNVRTGDEARKNGKKGSGQKAAGKGGSGKKK
jgi:hypothetical protein